MKISILHSTYTVAKTILLLLVVAYSFTFQPLSAQSSALVSPSKEKVQPAQSAVSFQSTAFPIWNTNTIKVIYEDQSGNGATIQIQDSKGRILHSQNCLGKKATKVNLTLLNCPTDLIR